MPDPVDTPSEHFSTQLLKELQSRVDRLSRSFDFTKLRDRGSTLADIKRYYEDSRLGYWFVHSKEGAIHMALNPHGRFDRAGYEGQVDLVEERMGLAEDVLELACGNGFNLALLAKRHSGRRFVGVDLVGAQVDRASKLLGSCENARVETGDYQALTFEDGSQDLIFVVESFCHATDLDRAFSEQHRVLREKGSFIVIDAWRTERFFEAPQFVREAAADVERALAVSKFLSLNQWIAKSEQHGFRITENLDLSEQIKPNLARLSRVVEKFLAHPRLAAVARLVLPNTLIDNAIAGYLMPLTLELGVHSYRLLELKRV